MLRCAQNDNLDGSLKVDRLLSYTHKCGTTRRVGEGRGLPPPWLFITDQDIEHARSCCTVVAPGWCGRAGVRWESAGRGTTGRNFAQLWRRHGPVWSV